MEFENTTYGKIRCYITAKGKAVLTYRDETTIIPKIKYIDLTVDKLESITEEEAVEMIKTNEAKKQTEHTTMKINDVDYSIFFNPIGSKTGPYISYQNDEMTKPEFVNVKRDFKIEDSEAIIKEHIKIRPKVFETNKNIYKVFPTKLNDLIILYDDGEGQKKIKINKSYNLKFEDITIKDIMKIKRDSMKAKVLFDEDAEDNEPKKEEPKPEVKATKKKVTKDSDIDEDSIDEPKEVKQKPKKKK